MKPTDVKTSTYIDFDVKNKDKDPNFKVGDLVRLSKHEKIIAKGYIPIWSEEVFIIENVKNTASWIYVICYLNREEIAGTFYEKELQKIIWL